MPLEIGDFAARRINWESKALNLAELAAELSLGLDSFIFVDDNPKECTEVQAHCPEVLALALPPCAEDIPAFLEHVWAFDHARVTDEDRRRATMYAQQAERARLERQSASFEEFLASLKLEVRIAPATAEQLPRVAQLTLRTNQMNATTLRRTENEVRDALARGRRVPGRGSERPLRQLWPDGRGHLPRRRRRACRGHVPAELPRARPRRGASHARRAGRSRASRARSRRWRSPSCPRRGTAPRCCFSKAWARGSRSARGRLFPLPGRVRRRSGL